MQAALPDISIAGFLIAEYVPHAEGIGAQLLLGLRNTPDLGPVVTVGPGGVHTETLAMALDGGRASAVFAPRMQSSEGIARRLGERTVIKMASGAHSIDSTLNAADIADLVERLLAFAESDMARGIDELEFNPVVRGPHGAIALDALVRLSAGDAEEPTPAPPRPLHKLDALLRPQTVAIIGVSTSMNPGRVILENMLAAGFPADGLAVVKPGVGDIAGVRCYPTVEDLPGRVDLCVVSLAAPDVPSAIDALVRHDRAESIVVVSGGIGERAGTDALEAHIRATLARARGSASGGPIVNGANCLGIRSVPGRYDATFIPPYKRPPAAHTAPLAIVAQSGAFMVSRGSKLLGLNPRYMISVGNQLDLTVGDYLTYLERDQDVRAVACYIEGFRPGDGRRWLEAAARLTRAGRTVMVYRAGRSAAGVEATISHTAAIAGDYAVFRELAESVGALVAESLEDFDDLVRMHCYLTGKSVGGLRLGVVSNAGFECVAAADNLGPFSLAALSPPTEARLASLLGREGLGGVVEPHNPVDLTPILGDEPFAAAVEAVLSDAAVDVAVVGCVPLTPALHTLAAAPGHTEDITRPDGVVQRLVRLYRGSQKPFVVVVDAGPMYDPMAQHLLAAGVPVFRTMDRALGIFGRYCASRSPGGMAATLESNRPLGEPV
jgi:acyl-CoA synthetase (NDP forming)